MNSKFALMGLVIASLQLFACDQANTDAQKSNAKKNEQVVEPLTKEQADTTELASNYPQELPKGRLPSSIYPTSYNLDLTIDPDQSHFQGKTRIELILQEPSSHIWLHGKDLTATSVSLKLQDGSLLQGTYQQLDDTGVSKISFEQQATTGNATLIIDYSAPFNTSLEGLYKVKDGELNYVFTQFEATAARLAFPSFDEPAFKVPFTYSMTVRNEHSAFTNTPAVSETDLGNGFKRIVFAKSKPLPTYLIAFSVGEFDVIEWNALPTTDVRDFEIPLRGIAPKGKGDKLNYALENTKAILESLENYFQIPYPYAKLDIVAAPDFAFGAMENAGLIIYREQLLLLDESSSLRQKRSYMNVHAHELAHQWFGNLVTPEWWDDIWLNEAFATWMAYTSNHTIFPEQKFDETLLQRSLGAMGQDSLISARQIRQPIESNHDIDSAFDGITYSKGGGVLRMLESFLTPEKFQAGIQHYMKKFAFKNATANDFITAIGEKAENIPVDVIRNAFNSFLEQPGIPYLDVAMQCQDNQASIEVNQSRYLPVGSKGSTQQTWQVPACLGYAIDGTEHQYCQVFDKATQTIELPEAGCPDFLVPNSQGAGYYRYSMSGEAWQNLFKHKDMLSTVEMMSANDSFDAAINAGKLNFTDLVQVAPELIDSSSAKIATAPLGMLSFAYDKIAQTESQKDVLAKVNQNLYANKLKALGLTSSKDDSVDDTQLRTSLINFLAKQGQDQTIRQTLTDMATAYTGYQKDHKINNDNVDSNLIGSAIAIAVDQLGTDYAKHLLELLKQANDGTIRNRLLNGLAAVEDPEFAQELRELIKSETVRDNEIFIILFGQMSKNELRPAMWQWFKDNFEAIKARISGFSQARIPFVANSFCTLQDAKQVEAFFEPRVESISGAKRTLAQVLESINLCHEKVEHHSKDINQFIETQQQTQ
ncbi:MAG: M1 family metallopeptidase [Kangiellaceae bacterium]|nr:M1 family metallopeptidase [Kangiellaceae bacterium]